MGFRELRKATKQIIQAETATLSQADLKQKLAAGMSLCNEVESSLTLNQVDQISIAQFCRIFEILDCAYPQQHQLPDNLSAGLTDMARYLWGAYSSTRETPI